MKQKEQTPTTNIEGDLITYPTNIKVIKEYYEQLHANKFSNLEEMDVLLKGYKPPQLSQEKWDNLSIHIPIK